MTHVTRVIGSAVPRTGGLQEVQCAPAAGPLSIPVDPGVRNQVGPPSQRWV